MTFNTTLATLIQGDRPRLVAVSPLQSASERHRSIFVPPAIASTLRGDNPSTGFPHAGADVVVAKFIQGWLMQVALDEPKSKKARPDVERLVGLDEI